MKERGMTLTELAKRLGISLSTLSDKFRRDNFNERDLRKIADVLNCDVEIVFSFRDSDSKI
jgi:DNA-binding helix-turn-helix protein